jgi:hypothetical protein
MWLRGAIAIPVGSEPEAADDDAVLEIFLEVLELEGLRPLSSEI